MPVAARVSGIASHHPRRWRGKRVCKHRTGAIGIVLLCAGIGAMAEESAAGVEALAVPSGQEVRFLETVHSAPGPDGLAIRFRFVAPAIARTTGTIGAEAAQADMEWLCNNYALPRLPAAGPVPSQIIVSLSDREVAFGEPAPEATQFFEAYAVEGGHCVWEAF